MSLTTALNLGANALAVQQTAVQVTGNNIANAGSATYTRQTVNTTPAGEQQIQQGIFVGEGVDIDSIQRQLDTALQTRLDSATSNSSASSANSNYLGQVESAINALGTSNISSQLTTFFGDWSTLASNPQDTGQRQVVVQDGENVASTFSGLSSQLASIQSASSSQISADVTQANSLASQIASLNGQILNAEGAAVGSANSLLDQRDAAVQSLSKLANVTTTAQPDGTINVYIGSGLLVTGTTNAGLALQPAASGSSAGPSVVFQSDGGTAAITSGEIGGLIQTQGQIAQVGSQLDSQANSLIFELNKLSASGQGTSGFSTVTSTNAVSDPTAALSSAAAGLPNAPTNGSFVVHVTDGATGLSTSTLVNVSLTGNPATDASLNTLQGELGAVPGVSAKVVDGKLTIAATGSNDTISFSQDSSGALAALGINTFFTGSNASNIAVNSTVAGDPALVTAAKNGDPADNQTALAIAGLQSQSLTSLGGSTLNDAWESMVGGVANSVASASSDAQASSAVVTTLTNQRDALSGVSLDEEAVNLIQQQQAYTAAARLISTVNDMMTTLLAITTTT